MESKEAQQRAERLTRKHYTEWHHQENGPQHESYAALVVDIAAELMAVQRETRENCAERVPTNWLHPFLTGTKAVIGKPPYNCIDIQNLLLKVAQAIRGGTP